MAALTAEHFAALQSLLKASSKDVVRQLCQESFSSSALGSKNLLDITCSSLSVTQEEAKELLQALHRLTRLATFRDLSSAESILALFPENFHQNLKNLLTKIILEHVSTWRTEAQANQISLPRLIDLDWRVDIKTASDSISRMAVPTCLLQMKGCLNNEMLYLLKTRSPEFSTCKKMKSKKIPVCVGTSPPSLLSPWN
uniref:COMM domain containing 9 n=1 Tax=Oryctolagus cuniculus TaxID=9986 RepID=A0A5F9CDH3_RABIT